MSKQFYEVTKGHLGQYEDWWNYDAKTGVVTHHWDYVTVKGLSQDAGNQVYSTKEFLDGDHHGGAKSALRVLLNLE
jgi:hypothetical protein